MSNIVRILRGAIVVPFLGVQLIACASSPDSIAPANVSTMQYNNWSCQQVLEENNRLVREVERVSGQQQSTRTSDAVMLTVGLLLFWPALFGMSMKHDQSGQLALLKGEYEATQRALREKNCVVNARTS